MTPGFRILLSARGTREEFILFSFFSSGRTKRPERPVVVMVQLRWGPVGPETWIYRGRENVTRLAAPAPSGSRSRHILDGISSRLQTWWLVMRSGGVVTVVERKRDAG